MPVPPLRYVDKVQFCGSWYLKLERCGHIKPVSRKEAKRVEENRQARVRCPKCKQEEAA